MAKSTRMMPFFLTMPISKMMAMMPTTDKSMRPNRSANSAPTPADGSVDDLVRGWDVALVEHPKNDIDRDQRGADERWFARERTLECLRIALKRANHRIRQRNVARCCSDGVNGLPERNADGETERQRDGRELSPVRDRQRPDPAVVHMDEH